MPDLDKIDVSSAHILLATIQSSGHIKLEGPLENER